MRPVLMHDDAIDWYHSSALWFVLTAQSSLPYLEFVFSRAGIDMTETFTDKVAFISGAASGLGFATAKAFAEAGAAVALTDLSIKSDVVGKSDRFIRLTSVHSLPLELFSDFEYVVCRVRFIGYIVVLGQLLKSFLYRPFFWVPLDECTHSRIATKVIGSISSMTCRASLVTGSR